VVSTNRDKDNNDKDTDDSDEELIATVESDLSVRSDFLWITLRSFLRRHA
jgi:hypothetical protein